MVDVLFQVDADTAAVREPLLATQLTSTCGAEIPGRTDRTAATAMGVVGEKVHAGAHALVQPILAGKVAHPARTEIASVTSRVT
jgi:hypothetical protein